MIYINIGDLRHIGFAGYYASRCNNYIQISDNEICNRFNIPDFLIDPLHVAEIFCEKFHAKRKIKNIELTRYNVARVEFFENK